MALKPSLLMCNSRETNTRGNKNEIDIVCVNNDKKTMLIAEVKRQSKKIDLSLLRKKSEKLLLKYSQYDVKYVAYSLDDI